jgi:hypothetical protein
MNKSMNLKTTSSSLVSRKMTDDRYESILNDARIILEVVGITAIVPNCEHIAFTVELCGNYAL